MSAPSPPVRTCTSKSTDRCDSDNYAGSPNKFPQGVLSDDEKSQTMVQQSVESQGQQSQDYEDDDSSGSSGLTYEIADIVIGNPVIMQNLLQSLSHCTSNKLAFMFTNTSDCLASFQKNCDQVEPVTVGDLVFTVLKNLKDNCSDRNLMVDNLFRFFAGHPPVFNQVTLTRLSEPLLYFTLRLLSSSSTLKKFIEIGLCANVIVVSTL